MFATASEPLAEPSPPRNPVIAVLGSTGTGKSQLAVALARNLAERFPQRPFEIINVDAMQLYAGLPIITNKITPEEQQGIVHHLLGCVRVDEEPWRVSRFVHEARRLMADLHARNGVPVLVGGTHYYLQSLLFGQRLVQEDSINNEEETNLAVQDAARGTELAKLDEMTTAELYKRLQQVDAVLASRWHPNDRRKIRRSLEIWLQTGRMASEIYAEQQQVQLDMAATMPKDSLHQACDAQTPNSQTSGSLEFPTAFFWTHTSRSVLTDRLDARVDKMYANGLVDEVSQLREALDATEKETGRTVDQTQGIWVSIGFKEFLPYLQRLKQGIEDQEERLLLQQALDNCKSATRQYAKSQLKWIRIKLLVALQEAGALEALWPLSTDLAATDERQWEQHVVEPAVSIATQFLQTNTYPDQSATLPQAMLELLQPARSYDVSRRPDLWVTQTCEVCNVTATTPAEWDKHVRGNRHGKLMRKRRQREQRAQLLQQGAATTIKDGESADDMSKNERKRHDT